MDQDPVQVIQTLQAYKTKLEAQIETLRADIATCKKFQAKYGTRFRPQHAFEQKEPIDDSLPQCLEGKFGADEQEP